MAKASTAHGIGEKDLFQLHKSHVSLLDSTKTADEVDVKNMQDLSKDLQIVLAHPDYPLFLEYMLKIFLKVLREQKAQFISDHSLQQVRKLLLEIIHRLPTNQHLKNHVDAILNLLFDLLSVENEDNSLVCLRIIIELHTAFRPEYSPKIESFLKFVKGIYGVLSSHLSTAFEPRKSPILSNLHPDNLEAALAETYTLTTISMENPEKQYTLIPRATMSFKVLTELPIIVALAYQLYRQHVLKDIKELIPLFMHAITLKPPEEYMLHANFNRELFVDFIAAQIKTLSFLAHIFRTDQDSTNCDAQELVKGMLGLFRLCPQEVTHLRKELLIAARYILSTNMRERFIDALDDLLEENILIGSGWTALEALRPSAYSMLADFVFHVRQNLCWSHLSKAVTVFSKVIHDETLATSIQTMSCKLLLNLVEFIRTKAGDEKKARMLFMKMMEVFVLKFKTVAKVQLPVLRLKKEKSSPEEPRECSGNDYIKIETKEELLKSEIFAYDFLYRSKEDRMPKYDFPSQSNNYSLADCQSLVKTLVCGVKTVAYGIIGKKFSDDNTQVQSKLFIPNKTFVFVRLLKYALEAVDVFSFAFPDSSRTSAQTPSASESLSKDEKEVLGHLAGVYTSLHPFMFKEVFSTMIGHMVDRSCTNSALQVLTNSFLANCDTSAVFAKILIEHLLKRMDEIGSNMVRSNLYIELYKLVLGSLSLFPSQNEKMLKPYLQQIVNSATEHALTAKEPRNYYLLLIALFDSIGKGDHELMFMEFLSILPTLLGKFNHLLSRNPRTMYKELFVELCLTVPVTLSSWLPYLDKLMYPIIAAINGSQPLITQGLSTLEVCATSFQPFASDCLEPVRSELMQALWQLLRSDNPKIAQTAFKVLGKFGGINRESIMVHPEKLNYKSSSDSSASIAVSFQFFNLEQKTIHLPVGKIIEKAYDVLMSNDVEPFYQARSWEIMKAFLSATIDCDKDYTTDILRFFSHRGFENDINPVLTPLITCPDEESRKTMKLALAGMLVAASKKKLRETVTPFMMGIVQHYSILMVGQECGVYVGSGRYVEMPGMDPLVLIDAVMIIVQENDSEMLDVAKLTIALIIDTAFVCMASEVKACRLPFFSYLVDKILSLCYDGGWYAKRGGCLLIQFVVDRMPASWVFQQMFRFIRALFFVMYDLATDVSSGTVDLAKSVVDQILSEYCAAGDQDDNDELTDDQREAIHEIISELIRLLTSLDACVRCQVIRSFHLIASANNVSVPELLLHYKELLLEVIPPVDYHLRNHPIPSQIAMLEAVAFCMEQSHSYSSESTFYQIDLENSKHSAFFNELKLICELDEDFRFRQVPCYHPATDFVPLQVAALRLLSMCYYIESQQQDIFLQLHKSLSSTDTKVQIAAFEALKRIVSGGHFNMRTACSRFLPILTKLNERNILSEQVIINLSYLSALFPISLKTYCDQLLQHLKALVARDDPENVDLCLCIIRIFTQIADDTSKLIPEMLHLILDIETGLMLEAGSPFREPVVKFLSRYPVQTIKLLLLEPQLQSEQAGTFITFLFAGQKGEEFRECLKANSNDVVNVLCKWFRVPPQLDNGNTPNVPESPMRECYATLKILSILTIHEEAWFIAQEDIIAQLKEIWTLPKFVICQQNLDVVDFSQRSVPKLIVKCLLCYFKHYNHEISLLFSLLRVFTGQYLPEFEFFRKFLQFTVANTYSVDWKWRAFLQFVHVFRTPSYSQDLKAKILQYVLIPGFAFAFENHDVSSVVNRNMKISPYAETNIISIFINEVVDPKVSTNCSDSVRILLLQLSSLFVEKAHQHIQFTTSRTEENKLRKLMTFAWPCLLTKNCVDPAAKYHGHLLLASIIAKFTIHKKIVLQVFHSLLKAHVQEARTVVQQALEILTPVMPIRMEDNNSMLTHWTKKIMVEEGHTLPQLVHLLQLLVRHYKVYKPVRHHLIKHMINSVQRLCNMSNVQLEHKKLAIDVAEVIIRWELEEELEERTRSTEDSRGNEIDDDHSHSKGMEDHDSKGVKGSMGASAKFSGNENDNKPIEKDHADAVVNFLLHMACQVTDASSSSSGLEGEQLCRRCILLLKTAMQPSLWPDADLKATWLDSLLNTVESQQPNYGNACVALELMAFYVFAKRRDPSAILATIKHLQAVLILCMKNQNMKVIQGMQNFIYHLMNVFPVKIIDGRVCCENGKLDDFYGRVDEFIVSGLKAYGNTANCMDAESLLYGTITILKGACKSDPAYVDHLVYIFIPVLAKVVIAYLDLPSEDNSSTGTELVVTSLNMINRRCKQLPDSFQAMYVNDILVVLVERCREITILRMLIQVIDEWITLKADASPLSPKHIVQLLEKMMKCFDERQFPDEPDLINRYLELIYRIYSQDTLISPQCHEAMEPAFMAGLRSVNPHLRAKFVAMMNKKLPLCVFARMMSMVTTQDWRKIGHHFWIKQFIELITIISSSEHLISCPITNMRLPPLSSVIDQADSKVRDSYFALSPMKINKEVVCLAGHDRDSLWQHLLDKYCVDDLNTTMSDSYWAHKKPTRFSEQIRFLARIQKAKTFDFLRGTSQLCHLDSGLAENVWIQLFPKLWEIFDEDQKNMLSGEVIPFLCGGQMTMWKHVSPNPLSVFAESVLQCKTHPEVEPDMLKHMGISLNIWHRAAIELENLYLGEMSRNRGDSSEYNAFSRLHEESLLELVDLYSKLNEDDLCAAVWSANTNYPELVSALAFESQGEFNEAKDMFEIVQDKCRESELHLRVAIDERFSSHWRNEVKRLAFDRWVRCAEQLSDWNSLNKYVKTEDGKNPFLIMDSHFRSRKWQKLKETLGEVEQSQSEQLAWKANLFKGYLSICHPDDRDLSVVESEGKVCSSLCIREWNKLPPIVSHCHLPILQAAQQIMELKDAAEIHEYMEQEKYLYMRAIIKKWPDRLPALSDDFSYWSALHSWRDIHMLEIAHRCSSVREDKDEIYSYNHFGLFAYIHSNITVCTLARKQGNATLCLKGLSKLRVEDVPHVPPIFIYQKLRQMLKCHLQLSLTKNEEVRSKHLTEGITLINSINLNTFEEKHRSELCAMKGEFCYHLNHEIAADIEFATAIQTCNKQMKSWAMYGEFLEKLFMREIPEICAYEKGCSAIVAYMNACQFSRETMSRRCLARTLWILTFDNQFGVLGEHFMEYSLLVEAHHWAPWLPQLVAAMGRSEGKFFKHLLCHLGCKYPSAVYFPLRNLYYNLRAYPAARSYMCDIERNLSFMQTIRPAAYTALERIEQEIVWFRENAFEETLRELRQILSKVFDFACDCTLSKLDRNVSKEICNSIFKLMSNFDNNGDVYVMDSQESLSTRSQFLQQDPVYVKMKAHFEIDFNFNIPGATKFHKLICKLKKWINVFEAKVKFLPKSYLLEERCKYLSEFTQDLANLEIPGELLYPRPNIQCVTIAQFMPKVRVVRKGNAHARRLYIRGHNGKMYPYLVVNAPSENNSRSEERVLQFFRFINTYLSKQKETSRRFLNINVPRITPLTPHMRIIEDHVESQTLFDIYKQYCEKNNMDHDAPMFYYFERMVTLQTKSNDQIEITGEIMDYIHDNMVPTTILKDWALQTYPTATDYWTFRKQFTLQHSLISFFEYCLYLNVLNPDMLNIHMDTGKLEVSSFCLEISEKGVIECAVQVVPFRLTPNIVHFITEHGKNGPMTSSMIAIARCLTHPKFQLQYILKAILKEEVFDWYNMWQYGEGASNVDANIIISRVINAVNAIWVRLDCLTQMDEGQSTAKTLCTVASTRSNICQMKPTWHPWL